MADPQHGQARIGPAWVQDAVSGFGRLIGQAPEQIAATVAARSSLFDLWTPIPIKRNASFEELAYIRERPLQFAGIHVTVESVREYPDGPAFAHVLGYVGPMTEEQFDELQVERQRRYTRAEEDPRYLPSDRIGQAGIEGLFENAANQILKNPVGRSASRCVKGIDEQNPGFITDPVAQYLDQRPIQALTLRADR